MAQPQFAFVFSSASQFVPVTTSGQLCTPDMVMLSDGDGDVTFTGPASPGSPIMLPPPGGKGQPRSMTLLQSATAAITVKKGKSPTFSFWVCDVSGNYQAYALAGVALQNTQQGGNGFGQFPKVVIDIESSATVLQLSDNNKDSNPYEFYVLVQNSAGQLGLIDPRIVNQN